MTLTLQRWKDGDLLIYNNASGNWITIASSDLIGSGTGGLDAVVDDLAPQLGGDLDVNLFSIVSVEDALVPDKDLDIRLLPALDGEVQLGDGAGDGYVRTVPHKGSDARRCGWPGY